MEIELNIAIAIWLLSLFVYEIALRHEAQKHNIDIKGLTCVTRGFGVIPLKNILLFKPSKISNKMLFVNIAIVAANIILIYATIHHQLNLIK
ncbi:hypothetical protein [Shewanella sp. NIFS-20-20]|uniref:hypothetical protein n=1 Tax=Shewanella sp. NIFS-20-20 TaxID=2853806 RepID=UPI001C43D6F0|nr:hypothetical protein [Shewanella sp. NIFS-20-20]MBV7317549.1 hypothetical protein [Shewanella sp. NIFS-20-20]